MAARITWHALEALIGKLARDISTDGVPDILIAIQRGGLVPAVMLAHELGVARVRTIGVRRTIHEGLNSPKTPPRRMSDEALEELNGLDAVIVDDVVGSGQTLRLVHDLVGAHSPSRVRTAVVVVNTENWEKENQLPPGESIEYIGSEHRGWIVFPWERASKAP